MRGPLVMYVDGVDPWGQSAPHEVDTKDVREMLDCLHGVCASAWATGAGRDHPMVAAA
eukprot:gene46083-22016_t